MLGTLIHPPKTMLEVWEALPEGTLCQLINNKLIMSPAPQNLHQVVLFDLAYNLKTFLNQSHLGELRISPYDVHFSKENILQPDLLFIKNENLNKINENGLNGAPDMIIEVLSPATSLLDFEEKKLIYERFGVQEYFIVDPNSKSVYAWFFNGKKYEEQETLEGKIKSLMLHTEIAF